YFVRTGKETVQHLCRTVCVCLVQVELCPYKPCSVDFLFSVRIWGFLSQSVLLVLTYLVSVGVCFLVWFRFIFFPFRCRSQRCYLQRHIESLTGNLGVLSNDGFIKK
uniref:Uncharacterized protein n=1 Tax=Geospiza parvula TaxID=87175 RepID=A0A8C3NAV5_GEOPR